MKDNDKIVCDVLDVEMGDRCDYDCKNCHKYFKCVSPYKGYILSQGRLKEIVKNIHGIKSILVVMGGKGGVGKSTISSQLAMGLALRGYEVGIIDCDFHGPSIPRLLGIREGQKLVAGKNGIIPVEGPYGIKVVSAHFLTQEKESLTWFDAFKREALEGFLAHVCYGKLDFLVVDLPPGTGSETINLIKYLPRNRIKVLIVTTPSDIAQGVARRCISLCKSIPVPVLGLIENMAHFTCPICGHVPSLFMSGAARRLVDEENIGYLGSLPLDIELRKSADKGKCVMEIHPGSPSSKALSKLVDRIGEGRKQSSKAVVTKKKLACPRQESVPEVLKMNMDFGCGDRRCDDCDKYFACPFPYKKAQFQGPRNKKIENRMSLIENKIAVVSGKGGVGKSTVSANLALGLALEGYRVGLLDSDFHGPCLPKFFGLEGARMRKSRGGIQPVEGPLGIKIISLGFVLDRAEPVTWFHENKRGALGDFLAEVEYGELDWLIIDLPPGTGSENFNILRDLPHLDGVVVVTIPSVLSREIVKRGLSLFKKANVPILGLIVNMAGFVCSACGALTDIFSDQAGASLANELGIPLLGEIRIHEGIARSSDRGRPFILECPESRAAREMRGIVGKLEARVRARHKRVFSAGV